MINISQELKNEFNNQDVSLFTHKIHFYDYTTETETILEDNISNVKESIGIDGMPIGKFPIGVLTFEISGDYTKTFRVNGNYYVWTGDSYTLNYGTENETVETLGSKFYFINKAEYDKKSNKTRFECYDSANKLNVKFEGIPSITYPCTFEEYVMEFYLNYGMSVDLTDLFNADFVIASEPIYPNGCSALDVAREIGKFALSVQFINDQDIVKIIRASKLKTSNTTTEQFDNLKEFSIESDFFKTLGINTLVLGLQSDIDSENVTAKDENMIDSDGNVELRLDNIPFVPNQSSKLGVINAMFEEVKGFKYKAFQATGKQFYYEIGDIVGQVGLGDNGESFNLLILDKELARNGSMITTYKASSQSVQETQYKWTEFTPIKRTEILVDKANQQISLINQELSEQGNKFSEIESTIESIRLEVSQLGGYNIIPNVIGEFGVTSWSFISEPFNFRSSTPYAVFNALPIYFINNNGSIMYSVTTSTASKSGFRFWKDGVALSDYAIAEGGSDYSLYTKVKGSGVLRFKLREYTSPSPSGKDTYHKETLLATSIVNNSFTTLTGTLKLQTNTVSVVLVVESDVDVYTQQYADFTDTSFNLGNPKPYGESLTDMNDRLIAMNTVVDQTAQQVTISANKVTEVEGKLINQQSQINVQANEISSKVSQNGIVSAINQTSETIKIDASKINLNGYVTVSALSGNGTTTINGDNIKTGTISANRLDLSGVAKYTDLSTAGSTTINGSNITTGTINASRLNLTAYAKFTDLSTNGNTTIHGGNITTGTLSASKITSGIIDASKVTVTNLNASNITTGTISANRINFNGATGTNMDITGKITATSGTIGGMTLSSGAMTSGSGTSYMRIDGGASVGAMWFGNSDYNSAPFRVNKSGAIVATSATITGNITANSGKVGNYTISSGSLVGNGVTLMSDRIRYSTGANIRGYNTASGASGMQLDAVLTYATGNFNVVGQKNAIVPTRNGIVAVHAYETALPHFGDIGEAIVVDRIEIRIDEVFGDTIHLEDYHVFLSPYSDAKVWVTDRTQESFVINTDRPTTVSYEIKGIRRGYRDKRLEVIELDPIEYGRMVGDLPQESEGLDNE